MKQTEGKAKVGSIPEPSVHFTLKEEIHFANRIQVANSIAEQIWREQQLVSNRMQWNFTFQAFLAGIYVFAGSNINGLQQVLVQSVLSIIGFAVSWFCLFGVIAAQNQSSRLKTHWANEFCKTPPNDPGDCDITRGAFPQPFSKKQGSNGGRLASRGVCMALMGMWVLLLLITIVMNFAIPKPTSTKLVCTVGTLANKSSDLTISCKSN